MSALPDSNSSPTETMDGIGQAFFAALDRDGGPVVTAVVTVLAVALFVLLVRWVRRETRREAMAQQALDARHRAALAAAATARESREWVRVATRVPVTLRHRDARQRLVSEECEMRNLSGGGGAFLSKRPPPPGLPIELTIDLGEARPLALRGIVVRVEPPRVPGEPSLVGMRMSDITTAEREHLVRWIAHVDADKVAQARRGRLCARCGRPLPAGPAKVHAACGAPTSSQPPPSRRSSSRPPRRSPAPGDTSTSSG